MQALTTEEKENLINITHEAVRSGLANGDYLDIEDKIKTIMKGYLLNESLENQMLIVHDLIVYLHKRVQVPGGRLGMIALINVGKIERVPKFLLDCATAVWGTVFKNKASSKRLRDLFLS